MLSPEFRFLIECVKISLLQNPEKDLIDLITHNNLDWERLKKMVIFHRIRPAVYEAIHRLPSSSINPDFSSHLIAFVRGKAIQNLLLTRELKKVESIFKENEILAMPFKGVSWSNYLYPASFREGSDIDFLIAKKDLFRALDLLLKDGFQVKAEEGEQYSPEDLVKALYDFGQIEVTLFKESNLNLDILLDFHWDLLIQAQNMNFNVDELFLDNFSAPEKILLIIIIHNGKREAWTKLKYICDLVLFVHRHGTEINWDSFIERIDKFDLKKNLIMGLSLVNLFFPVNDTIQLSYPLDKPEPLIIKYWEKSDYYELKFKTRLDYFRLLLKSHKDLSETRYYLLNYIRYLSYPNPREKRLFTFSKERTSLNLLSKIISYSYYKRK